MCFLLFCVFVVFVCVFFVCGMCIMYLLSVLCACMLCFFEKMHFQLSAGEPWAGLCCCWEVTLCKYSLCSLDVNTCRGSWIKKIM